MVPQSKLYSIITIFSWAIYLDVWGTDLAILRQTTMEKELSIHIPVKK